MRYLLSVQLLLVLAALLGCSPPPPPSTAKVELPVFDFDDFQKQVMDKPPEEVKAILGHGPHSYGGYPEKGEPAVWVYLGRVRDPKTGKKADMQIVFAKGRVKEVTLR